MELAQANTARETGNEGQARVCARRAAGIAIRAFLLYYQKPVLSSSAVDLIQWVQTQPDLPEEARTAASRLLLRVTPDFRLPIEADLILETRQLILVT